MDNLIDRVSDIETRLKMIEDILGIGKKSKTRVKNMDRENEIEEQTVNGFTKSQLRVMFSWAKNTKLQLLSKNDFEELKKWNMLKDFYPDAPDNYEDIKL